MKRLGGGRESKKTLQIKRLGLGQESYTELAELFKFRDLDDFLAAIGYGDISPAQVANKIDDALNKSDESLKLKAIPKAEQSNIQVAGVGDLLTRMASCCKPVPGDPIVGYITRGKGVTVHRADCSNIANLRDTERLISVSWGRAQQTYPVVVHIEAFDRAGVLRDIAAVVADLGINMSSVNVTTRDSTANIIATMGIQNLSQLSTLLNKLQSLRSVLDAHREQPS